MEQSGNSSSWVAPVQQQQPISSSSIQGVSEDQAAKTIEFLRARLLSERSVSKAAREQTQLLTRKVSELEQRIEFEIRWRKLLEKERWEMLLKYKGDLSESHGHFYNDAYEDSEEMNGEDSVSSSSEQQGSESMKLLQSNGHGHDQSEENGDRATENGSTGFNGEANEASLTVEENSKRTLSWSRQRNDRLLTKSTNRSIRSFPQHQSSFNSSTIRDAAESTRRTWTGKSVRRIRVNKESIRDQSGANLEETETTNEGSVRSDCGAEVDMALEQQSKLMEMFEAEEDAQRAWEEKYQEQSHVCCSNASCNKEDENARMSELGANKVSQDLNLVPAEPDHPILFLLDKDGVHESDNNKVYQDLNHVPAEDCDHESDNNKVSQDLNHVPTEPHKDGDHESDNNKVSQDLNHVPSEPHKDGDHESDKHGDLHIEASAPSISSHHQSLQILVDQEINCSHEPSASNSHVTKPSISSSQGSCSPADDAATIAANASLQYKSENPGDAACFSVPDDTAGDWKFSSSPWIAVADDCHNLCSDPSPQESMDSQWEETLKSQMRAEILSQMENASQNPHLHADVGWQQHSNNFSFSTRNASWIPGDGNRRPRPESAYELKGWEQAMHHHHHHPVSTEGGLHRVMDVLRALQIAKQELQNSGQQHHHHHHHHHQYPNKKDCYYYPSSSQEAMSIADPFNNAYYMMQGRGSAPAAMASSYMEIPDSRYNSHNNFTMNLQQYAWGRADAMAQQMNPWSLQENNYMYPPSHASTQRR